MWHYEYTLLGERTRIEAESFEACLDALLRLRATQPLLSALAVFEGGTGQFGTGVKQYDSENPVG